MQRLIGLLMIMVLVGVSEVAAQETPTPDFEATATAIVRSATQTAQAREALASSTPTHDPFVFTATARVRQITQTAEAATGNTAMPVTAAAQGDTQPLTATALVEAATRTAGGDRAGDSNGQALSLTLLIFAAVVVGLVVLGVVVVGFNHETNGSAK